MIRAGMGIRKPGIGKTGIGKQQVHRRPAAITLAAMLVLAAGQAAAQEQVLVKRPAELREAPGEGSRSLGALAVQTPVIRLGERQGAWIRVSTGSTPQGTTGWVHMFDVAAPGTPRQGGNAATGALRSLTGFFNKGSAQTPASNLATSTVGIRGLGAEDIAGAQPNPAAVGRIEAMRMDAAQARQFARDALLSSQAVDALPEPPKPHAQTPVQQGFTNENSP